MALDLVSRVDWVRILIRVHLMLHTDGCMQIWMRLIGMLREVYRAVVVGGRLVRGKVLD